MRFGSSSKQYSPDIRLFCLTHHYYSPKAYQYLRETFDNNIPAPRTLRCWNSSIDGSPGFTDSAFDALEQMVKEYSVNGNVEKIKGALKFDEMAIRKKSEYNSAKKEFEGHISHGDEDNSSVHTPLATKVLVLILNGINIPFKIPVGFFFVNRLNGEEKGAIVMDAMRRIHTTGIELDSITFDGDPANIKAMKILGASFENDQPFFNNPNGGGKVYVVLDTAHMLKLIRNILGNKRILYDHNDEEIKWEYIENLIDLQIAEDINLGNKLTKTHAEYKNRIMNVKIAAQTISNSTANSIQYMDEVMKNEIFKNSKATTYYLRVMNNLFDIMNSKLGHCNNEFKRPLTKETVNKFTAYFQDAKNYIKGLKIEEDGIKKPILQSRSFTGYFGFLHNMTSIMGIYQDHIEGCNEFYTFTLSQDHVEKFFGCVRRKKCFVVSLITSLTAIS